MEAASAPRPPALRIPKPRRLLAALSDERLVEHVRRGDPVAFEVLYDRYSAGILGFCRHMLGSAADAEDAVQHTFIAAHADIQRAGARQLHVKAWLYTIARNRCLSMLRARREHVSDDSLELVSDGFTADVEQREDLRALLADVGRLPDDQREALVLAEVGDLSHDDISSVLGCEASKVKSLVFQARTALIDRRIARETPCEEIREQLATLRGGALRRSNLKHHLEICPGCSEYRDEIKRQRAMLALALPVVPSAALKAHVLGGVGISGGAAAAGAGGTAATAASVGFAQAGAAKLAIAAVVLAGGVGTAAVAENGGVPLIHKNDPAHSSSNGTGGGATGGGSNGSGGSGAAAAVGGGSGDSKQSTSGTTKTASQRSDNGSEHGFTPTKGASNGDAARQFAITRGKGKKTGLLKAHTKKARAKGKAKAHKKPTRQKHVAIPHVKTAPSPKAPTTPTAKTAPTKPTTTTPAKTQPTTPTNTQPAPSPTQTESTPAPTGNSGHGGGNTVDKTLGSGKRATTEVTG